MAETFGVRAYADLEAMLADVEAVSFAVTPEVQAQVALTAATAGKHLLLEKPVSTSLIEARLLARQVSERSLSSIVFLTARFRPEIADWLEEAGQSQWESATGMWKSSALASPLSPYFTSQWRRNKDAALWDLGPHALALIIPLMGSIVEVGARRADDAVIHLSLLHESGSHSTVDLCFEDSDTDQIELVLHAGDRTASLPQSLTSRTSAMVNAIESLVALARDGITDNPCDISFGLDIVRVLDAAERQMRGSS